jgi:ankyrin repeat protein
MTLEPLPGTLDYNHFYSYTMQSVLKLRDADPARQKKRIRNNKRFYELLVSDVGYPQALEILNKDPMKKDIDLSPPVRIGVKESDPEPYHRVIATLTVQMMNNGILSKEQIETSHYKDVMEKLIRKAGASPNVSSLENWVPLCEAIFHGDHVAVIDMLMNLGASTDPEVKYYPEVRYRPTPLMYACNDGERLLSVQALLRWKAKVNTSIYRGWTPLSIACAHCKSVELVKILLLAGADPLPHTRSPNASDPRHREFREDPLVVVRRAPSKKSEENMDQIAALLQQPQWANNGL